jgi:hypothetical protein
MGEPPRWQPTVRQERVLQAALFPDERAVQAWAAVRASIDPSRHDDDPEVQRLLPLVHHNLRALAVDDELQPGLAALTRQSWWAMHRAVEGAAAPLAYLQQAGIPTLVLKGVALALTCYPAPFLRPVTDLDVLVPTRRAHEAIEALEAGGWRLARPIPRNRLVRTRHSYAFTHPDLGSVDLHWQVSMPLIIPDDVDGSTDEFWELAEPLTVAGVATSMLCPADLVVHVCIHGAWSASGAQARWAADCTMVERTAGARLDWDRVVEQARRRRVVPNALNALRYVRGALGVPVPSAALDALAASAVRRDDERAFRGMARRVPTFPPLASTARFWAFWAEKSGHWDRRRRWREFPGHLEDEWELDHVWEIPIAAVTRPVRHLLGPPGAAE